LFGLGPLVLGFELCTLIFVLCLLLTDASDLDPRHQEQRSKHKVSKFKEPKPKTKDLHSTEILNAAAVAHGAKIIDSTEIAPSRYRCDAEGCPMMFASTAPAPKIKTGM